jgi:DNA-binding response OmpR family regulator
LAVASLDASEFGIPVDLNGDDMSGEREHPKERLQRSQKRVFIVEDELFLAMMLEDMLVELGHEVVAVASKLKDGLRMAQEVEFDLAILDVSLNGEKSLPIALAIEARGLPYIFATGYSHQNVEGARPGTPMLSKPYGMEDLQRILPA